jgi:hypothetical protein
MKMKIAKRCIANWISWVHRKTWVPVSYCIEDLFDCRYLPLEAEGLTVGKRPALVQHGRQV